MVLPMEQVNLKSSAITQSERTGSKDADADIVGGKELEDIKRAGLTLM